MPLGVYDFEPPEEVPTLRSVSVGGGIAAKLAAGFTSVADSVTDFVDKIDGPL